jgi:V/A-type H+-transporting ATPase subunit E
VTTIDDKLKVFAKIVFEKVEKDSEQKIADFTKEHEKLIENEKENVLRQSESMVRQMKRKAEAKRNQIISKANIDGQHVLLKKRKEILDRTIENIKRLAEEFTGKTGYLCYLERCISGVLSNIDSDDVIIFLKPHDVESYSGAVREYIEKYKRPDMKVCIGETEKDILGGCICEDGEKTMRIDCTMAYMIESNRELIGRVLMDNLQ